MKIHKISDRKSDLFKYCPRLEFIISLKNWHFPFLFIPPHATVHPAPRPPLPHQFATSNSASIFRVLKPDFKGTQAEKTVGVWRISLRQLYDKAVYLLWIRVKEVEMYNSFHIHFPYRPLCGYKGEIVTSLPHIPALPPSMPAFYQSLWFLPLGNRDRYYRVLWSRHGVEFGPTQAIPLLELCLCCIRTQPHPVKHQPDTAASTPNGWEHDCHVLRHLRKQLRFLDTAQRSDSDETLLLYQ